MATLANISKQSAWKAARSGHWRGASLDTRQVPGHGGRGKVWEIRAGSLPTDLLARLAPAPAPEPEPKATREALWDKFHRAAESLRERAAAALQSVSMVEALERSGVARPKAVQEVASLRQISTGTLYRHLAAVRDWPRADWLPALLPGYHGRMATANFSEEAWAFIREDYLRLEAPALSAVVDRARRIAKAQRLEWEIPSTKTVLRRIEREISVEVRVLAREGREALDRTYPAQRRDHAWYQALEAVNADGHRFDVFCRWPDGTVARPTGVFWQDIYSGKLLSHRIDQTENTDSVRLSFGDLVEAFGIPDHAYLDNGRGFASKWMTGGTATRYRFKVKEEEPAGILTQMGVEIHWATPYHGQAKPIERAFRDLCEYVAKHPSFAGAYTGNNTTAKPENYGSRAIPIALFQSVLATEVEAHNARLGRRSAVCQGRSFDEVFRTSLAQRSVRTPADHQRRLWLLAAESVPASRETGEITLAGNRYWAETLTAHRGKPLVVRFDPERLHETVWCYTRDGRFIGPADCTQAAGFGDTEAAREHTRQRARRRKAVRAQLDAERRMNALQGVLPLDIPEPQPAPIERFPAQPAAEDDFDTNAAFRAASSRLVMNDS